MEEASSLLHGPSDAYAHRQVYPSLTSRLIPVVLAAFCGVMVGLYAHGGENIMFTNEGDAVADSEFSSTDDDTSSAQWSGVGKEALMLTLDDIDVGDLSPENFGPMKWDVTMEGTAYENGDVFSYSDAKSIEVVLGGNKTTNDELYTILMVDPDAPEPGNPMWKNILHWMVINVPEEGKANRHNTDGDSVIDFAEPAPPYGSHRYTQILLRQKAVHALDPAHIRHMAGFNSTNPNVRTGFGVSDFIAAAKLTPVNAKFFYTECDSSSSKKQYGMSSCRAFCAGDCMLLGQDTLALGHVKNLTACYCDTQTL